MIPDRRNWPRSQPRLFSAALIVVASILWILPINAHACYSSASFHDLGIKQSSKEIASEIKHKKVRVLLIGDSIATSYAPHVEQLLRTCAEVVLVNENAGNTRNGLHKLERWLGSTDWDVIHFNFGLHDLLLVDKDGKRGPNIDVKEYRRNLFQIVQKLKRVRGAQLVFATITPVPPTDPKRNYRDVATYNAAAMEIMVAMGIHINDLYAKLLPNVSKMRIPGEVHMNNAGAIYLADIVAQNVKLALAEGGCACP